MCISDSEICVICDKEFGDEDDDVTGLQCGHVMHNAEYLEW